MSNDFQKALKINKYVWDKWVWLSSTPCRDTKDLLFFSTGFSCHLNSNKIHWFNHGFAAWFPGKHIVLKRKLGCHRCEYHPLQPIAHLILAQLCHSFGLWSAAEGGTPVTDSDCLLQVPGTGVASLKQQKDFLSTLGHLGIICSQGIVLVTTWVLWENCLCGIFSSRNLSELQSVSIQIFKKMGTMVFKTLASRVLKF